MYIHMYYIKNECMLAGLAAVEQVLDAQEKEDDDDAEEQDEQQVLTLLALLVQKYIY